MLVVWVSVAMLACIYIYLCCFATCIVPGDGGSGLLSKFVTVDYFLLLYWALQTGGIIDPNAAVVSSALWPAVLW